jgi:hypothetical protein
MYVGVYTVFTQGGLMTKKSLKVDRKQFEGIVQNLLNAKPMKREKVKIAKKKPRKLFPPDETGHQ